MELNFLAIENGQIAIGHRPKLKFVAELKQNGVTHIVTIQSEKEGAKDIGKAVAKNQLEWIWIPVGTARPSWEPELLEEIERNFVMIKEALQAGGKLYIHCSAGIHRTGMFTNAFLRYCGYGEDESLALLEQLRTITKENVGEDRLKWGEQFYRPV